MILRGADIDAIFFDLDGTLVDSAPDLVAAMQRLRAEMSLPAIDAAHVGAVVSKGGRAMLRRAFAGADEEQIETLLPRFLELYSQAIATHTRTYPGIDALIDELERRRIKWGIVTNKPGWLARSLSAELKLDQRHAALVSGDCLPQKKPEPEPIFYACELAGVSPEPQRVRGRRRARHRSRPACWHDDGSGVVGLSRRRRSACVASGCRDRVASGAVACARPVTDMSDEHSAFASFERKWLDANPEQAAVLVFLRPAQRRSASAFGSLIHELTQTVFGVREAQVAGAKLGWWQQELTGAAAGNPRHPISRELFGDRPRGGDRFRFMARVD